MKASVNPLAYCEGGFYGGHLGLHDKIKPILKSATASFGITALNELEQLAHKKSLVEDGSFALKTMEHINQMVEKIQRGRWSFICYLWDPSRKPLWSSSATIPKKTWCN